MIDFIVSFNLFGEFYIFDNWDAAEERKRKRKEKKQYKQVISEELKHLEDEKIRSTPRKNELIH